MLKWKSQMENKDKTSQYSPKIDSNININNLTHSEKYKNRKINSLSLYSIRLDKYTKEQWFMFHHTTGLPEDAYSHKLSSEKCANSAKKREKRKAGLTAKNTVLPEEDLSEFRLSSHYSSHTLTEELFDKSGLPESAYNSLKNYRNCVNSQYAFYERKNRGPLSRSQISKIPTLFKLKKDYSYPYIIDLIESKLWLPIYIFEYPEDYIKQGSQSQYVKKLIYPEECK